MEKPYTKREQDIFFTEIRERFSSQDTVLKEIKIIGKDTSEKVGIQNGRMTKLEEWSNGAKTLIETNIKSNTKLVTDRKVLYVLITIVPIIFGITGYYALKEIVQTTVAENQQSIITTIEQSDQDSIQNSFQKEQKSLSDTLAQYHIIVNNN